MTRTNSLHLLLLPLFALLAVGSSSPKKKFDDGPNASTATAGKTTTTSGSATSAAADGQPAASCLAVEEQGVCAQYSVARSRFETVCKIGEKGKYAAPAAPCPTANRLAQCVRTDGDGFVETKLYYSSEYKTSRGKATAWTLDEIRRACKPSGGLADKDNKYVLTELAAAPAPIAAKKK